MMVDCQFSHAGDERLWISYRVSAACCPQSREIFCQLLDLPLLLGGHTRMVCCLLSLVFRTPTCSRSDPELLIPRLPPQLFTAAARTGLGPAPEHRSRGALPHLSRSFTTLSLGHSSSLQFVSAAHPPPARERRVQSANRSCPRTWCKSDAMASRSPARPAGFVRVPVKAIQQVHCRARRPWFPVACIVRAERPIHRSAPSG